MHKVVISQVHLLVETKFAINYLRVVVVLGSSCHQHERRLRWVGQCSGSRQLSLLLYRGTEPEQRLQCYTVLLPLFQIMN